jgi:hypothetical protein
MAGNAPAEALAAPDRVATLHTDIEAALGPLAKFEVRPPAAMTKTDLAMLGHQQHQKCRLFCWSADDHNTGIINAGMYRVWPPAGAASEAATEHDDNRRTGHR